ncbi:MAG: insulinase family protein [Bacteroidales bacterium]|nr:insulinase family protein [Bacteroidales bacterium]
MIDFKKFRLENGLIVLAHEDRSTPLTALNLLYGVGSRNENPDMTGIAHLLEHLMFCGTENVPAFDQPLQMAGGENNAFTNNDITNYYLTVPAENIETGFWLESDRMNGLNFAQNTLDIQKKVVIEEFNQRYLNQPYGDSMLLLRPLAYTTHPYRWPTIGIGVSHIESIELDHVKDFFNRYYSPENAILAITGNISPDRAYSLADKWFGPIEQRKTVSQAIPPEPLQEKARNLRIEKDVPIDALYKAWHICGRRENDFFTLDLLTDLLAGGESGRLHSKLVRGKNLFSEINAYLSSDIDPGLLILSGRLMKGVNISEAEQNVNLVIDELRNGIITPEEMEKVKNRFESSLVISNTSILNKAMNLAYYELLGDPYLVNLEAVKYRAVTREMVRDAAISYLNDNNCSTLYYLSKNTK